MNFGAKLPLFLNTKSAERVSVNILTTLGPPSDARISIRDRAGVLVTAEVISVGEVGACTTQLRVSIFQGWREGEGAAETQRFKLGAVH